MGGVLIRTNTQRVLRCYLIWSMVLKPYLAKPQKRGSENKVICDNSD